jgi:sugar phosphate isomerase/epimerase
MHLGSRAYSLQDVRFLAKAGFSFAEVEWKQPGLVSKQLPQLTTLQDKYGITYLAHGPDERDPFDTDDIVERMAPEVHLLLDLAPELGIRLYTQHLWLDPRFVSADTIACKLDVLETWLEHAARSGITFCIENLSEHADHLDPVFQRLPTLCLTLDVGHGQILAQPNASFELIARFPDRIRHVHLHDNHGGSRVEDDLHLPIGAGCVDFAAILRDLQAAGYDGGLGLEVKRESVEHSRDAIQSIWDGLVRPE